METMTIWNREDIRAIPYSDDFFTLPTHKVLELPDRNKTLGIQDFVVYGNPLPRDYGQIRGQYNRTAEPLKLALVENDYEWQVAVANWFDSELFVEQPYGLEQLIRRPNTAGKRNFRLHYARFLLPAGLGWKDQPYYDRYSSPCFTAYYFGTGESRVFINEFLIDAAYNADPISWNSKGRRAYTIPADWLSNRIDENAEKYNLFA